jgi:capsid protein
MRRLGNFDPRRDQKLWTVLRKLRDPVSWRIRIQTRPSSLGFVKVNMIGTHGLKLQPKVKNLRGDGLANALNKPISDEWQRWCKKGNCTMGGTIAFDELERLLVRTAGMDGEFLIIKEAHTKPVRVSAAASGYG